MAILTISREYGSGGREIGQAVAKLLGYEYINKEKVLEDIRSEGGKWGTWAENLDEHCPSVWEKYDWSFRGFAALVQRQVLNHAVSDKVVIMGRGGNFLLKDIPFAYRIRVQAPLEARAERIVKRETVDQDTARWLAEKVDNERACFIHSIYGKRWDDPAEYDRVFDTAVLSVEEIVQVVKQELVGRERRESEEARNVLKMRALAATVKAGIATNPHFFVPVLDVYFDGKGLVLRGITHNPKEHKLIEDEAEKLANGHSIRCELHYRK